ncbi:MAG: SigE family RNA polymerase sigma factor [Actinomycetota bacterium]|nr:SigE family RNA polymerase sigma factor [Actinomycetota bacterium]
MTRQDLERGDPVVHGGGSAAVGSSETFEEFYAREFPAVVGLAFALSGSRTASEDLAQEAFLAAHRNWERVAGYEQPDLWVRRVVSNMSMSMFRRRYAEARALARFALGTATTLPELSHEDAEFWAAVRSLPRRQAQVIALRYLDDRSVAEIAEILGTATGTVKKQLHDGRQNVVRRLRLEEDDT